MERVALGTTGLTVPRMGLGCMGMSFAYGDPDRDACLETLETAFELGINFLDTADMYGDGDNERLLGGVLKGRRDTVVLATKCGIVRGRTRAEQSRNNAPDYIRACCDASLQRLETDVIDLYYLHRLDRVTPLEDSIGTLADLVRAGKIRAIGLSDISSATLRKAHAIHPVSAVQNEYSLMTRGGEVEAVIDTCADYPETILASALWHMEPTLDRAIAAVQAGQFEPADYGPYSFMAHGGGSLVLDEALVPAEIVEQVNARKQEILDGLFRVNVNDAEPEPDA